MKLSRSTIKKFGITKKAWNYQRSLSSSGEKKKTRVRSVNTMAKRRKSFSRGSKSWSSAPIPTSGMVGEALKGVGAAVAVAKFAPNINIPYKYPIAGYLVGGLPGAIAAWFVAGQGATTTSGGIVLN